MHFSISGALRRSGVRSRCNERARWYRAVLRVKIDTRCHEGNLRHNNRLRCHALREIWRFDRMSAFVLISSVPPSRMSVKIFWVEILNSVKPPPEIDVRFTPNGHSI